MVNKIRQNYHWVIALLVFLEMIIFGGLLNCSSLFIIPVCDELNISRGTYSLAMVPYNVASIVSTVLTAFLFQKLGYKRTTIFGLLLAVASLLLTAFCKTLAGFCFGKMLLGIAYGLCTTAGAMRIVRDWFVKHQGLMVGIVSMSTGLGGSLLSILLTSLIEKYNWRIANVFLALACGLVIASYFLFMKSRPEEMGLRPFGYGTKPKISRSGKTDVQSWQGYSFQQWCRRPLFYLAILAIFITSNAMYFSGTVLMPHFQDLGFSAVEAAKYQSINMLALAFGKLLCGAATDRLGATPVCLFCIASGAFGQWLLCTTGDPMLCYAGSALCGISLCMLTIMVPLLGLQLFGYYANSSINSVTLAMCSLASMVSGPIVNLSFDQYGSYIPIFRVAVIINVVMLGVYILMFLLSKIEKKRWLKNPPMMQ